MQQCVPQPGAEKRRGELHRLPPFSLIRRSDGLIEIGDLTGRRRGGCSLHGCLSGHGRSTLNRGHQICALLVRPPRHGLPGRGERGVTEVLARQCPPGEGDRVG